MYFNKIWLFCLLAAYQHQTLFGSQCLDKICACLVQCCHFLAMNEISNLLNCYLAVLQHALESVTNDQADQMQVLDTLTAICKIFSQSCNACRSFSRAMRHLNQKSHQTIIALYTNVFHCSCLVYFEIIQTQNRRPTNIQKTLVQSYETLGYLDWALNDQPRISAFRLGSICILYPGNK